jgi:hypothetical protein
MEWLELGTWTVPDQGRNNHVDLASVLLMHMHAISLKVINFCSSTILVHLEIQKLKK